MPHEKFLKYSRKTRKKHMKGGMFQGPVELPRILDPEGAAGIPGIFGPKVPQGAAEKKVEILEPKGRPVVPREVSAVSNDENPLKKTKSDGVVEPIFNPLARRVSNVGSLQNPVQHRLGQGEQNEGNEVRQNRECVCLDDETLRKIVNGVSTRVGLTVDMKLARATIVTNEKISPSPLDDIYDLYQGRNIINRIKLNNLLRKYTPENRLYHLFAFMCENLGIENTCGIFNTLERERRNYELPAGPNEIGMTAREMPELLRIIVLTPTIQLHIPPMSLHDFFNQFGNGPNQTILNFLADQKKLQELNAQLDPVYYVPSSIPVQDLRVELVLPVSIVVTERVANIMRMKDKLRYVNLDFIGLNLKFYSMYELKYLELAIENLIQIEFYFMAYYRDDMRVIQSTPLAFLLLAYLHCLLCIVPLFTAEGDRYTIPLISETTLQLNMMVLSLKLKELNLTNLTALFTEPIFEYPSINVELEEAYGPLVAVPAAGVIQPNVIIGLQTLINTIIFTKKTKLNTTLPNGNLPNPIDGIRIDPRTVLRIRDLPVKYGYTTEDKQTEYVLVPAAAAAAAPAVPAAPAAAAAPAAVDPFASDEEL
jgi:hypothetical protein